MAERSQHEHRCALSCCAANPVSGCLSDSESLLTAIARSLPFRIRSPARLCAPGSPRAHPLGKGAVQATRQTVRGRKCLLRCVRAVHFPKTLFEGKNSNWTWGKLSELASNDAVAWWARQSCDVLQLGRGRQQFLCCYRPLSFRSNRSNISFPFRFPHLFPQRK